MKPRLRPESRQLDLFQAQFDQLLNLDHPLCVLSRKIDWQRFDVAFADCYSAEDGAPGKGSCPFFAQITSQNWSCIQKFSHRFAASPLA